jgi:hypothetical protein
MLRLTGIISAVRAEAHRSVSRPMVGFGARLSGRTAPPCAAPQPTLRLCQTDNAPPARLRLVAAKRAGDASFFAPLETGG